MISNARYLPVKDESVKPLTEHDRGWLEALIDGEGSLSLVFAKQKTSSRPRIDLRIDISNSDLPLIQEAHRVCGGGAISTFQPHGNRKRTYRISFRTSIIRKILPQLELIVKRKQKQLILEAISLIEDFSKKPRRGFQGGKMRPLWKDQKFAEIKTELNILNWRGRTKADPNSLVQSHID